MENKKFNESQFYVVHFVQKPFETIDYYVCVPYHWAIHKFTDKKVVVAYPKPEDPIVTRERVKKKEKHRDEWKFCSADLKYQTDTYDDAERWISKENNHRLLVQENSSKQQKVLKDQESCGSNQKHSLKSKDKFERTGKPYQIQIPQKSSLKDTNKRLFDESQIFLKRVSWSTTETAMSTTQSTAAANGVKSTEGSSLSSKQNNNKCREQDPSLPVIDLGQNAEVINSHSQQEQPRETNGSKNQLASNLEGAPKFPSPVEQSTQPNQRNNQKLGVTDVPITLITPSNNKKPRVADQVENIRKNVAITSQNPLNRIDPTKPLPMPSTRPVLSTQQRSPANSVTALQNIPKPHQHPVFVCQDVQQHLVAPQEHLQQMRGQKLPPKSIEHRLDPRLGSKSRPISEITQHQPIRPSFNNNPKNVPSQFHQLQDIQHQAQKTLSQQEAQQSQSPAHVPILPTNNKRSPTLQEVKQTTPSSILSRAPILPANKNYPSKEQEIKSIQNRISKEQSKPTASSSTSYQSPCAEPPRVDQNVDQYPGTQTQQVGRSDETNLTRKRRLLDDTVRSATNKKRVNNIRSQTMLCMQKPLSPNHSAALDFGPDPDHETASRYAMSVNLAHKTVNETNETKNYSVDRSTAPNFLSNLAMEQQKIEQFIINCTQVISNNLRNFLFETVRSYQEFIDNERINTSENSASHEPPSSTVTQEVSPVVKKKQTEAPERRNSSNGNQSSNDVTKAPERTYQRDSRRHSDSTQQLGLSPEYDPNDTKWTLKYQAHMTGLVELIPNTNIYVRYSELKRFEQVSNSYQSLTRLLLHEVFNEKALGVCATMTEIVEIDSKMSPDGRPALDNVGCLVLLDFVMQYASRSDWCVDVTDIINTIDQEVKEVRIKFGRKSRS